MHPALSTSYLLPAIFLNPVLFLHGLNTILSRIISPILEVSMPVQPPPYSTFGPSANHPHLDVHASDNLCWSYTVVMICAQLMAFGRVHRLREEGKEERRLKKARADAVQSSVRSQNTNLPNGHIKTRSKENMSENASNGNMKGVAQLQAASHLTKTIPRRSVSFFAGRLSQKVLIYHSSIASPSWSRGTHRAPAQPSIENTESSASSLVDVDSPHISSVPSDFESQTTQTKTQGERMAHEAEDKAREESAKASQKTKETAADADKKASEASSKASGKAKESSEYASEKADELSKDASNKYDKAKKTAARNYRDGKEEAKEKGNELSRNRDNPVVVGNALVIGIGSVALGFVGYQKYAKGELSWEVAGITAAAVSAFAVGDYYLSQYLFREKFPKK
ncbi:MAG: hypothetical protein Q9215_003952 [Flavoplaca cf. flavocitrina]